MEPYFFQQTPAEPEPLSEMISTDAVPQDATNKSDDNAKEVKLTRKIIKQNRRQQHELRHQNALRALALERELAPNISPTPTLLIRFPDPEINASTVLDVSQNIREVVFPVSTAPRQCMVHLKPGVNIEHTIADINRVRFGNGNLHAELKNYTDDELADALDPCNLYISNIPFNMKTAELKTFLNAMRVDIGVMKRQKRARYAYARYSNAELALEAFRTLSTNTLQNRKLTVRYRRFRSRRGPTTTDSSCCNTSQASATEEDTTECSVILPPPVEPIVISDSDEQCSNDSTDSIDHKSKSKLNKYDKKFQKLQRQMAEQASLIKSLQ
ncbi:Pof, partial [Drosophila busckii]